MGSEGPGSPSQLRGHSARGICRVNTDRRGRESADFRGLHRQPKLKLDCMQENTPPGTAMESAHIQQTVIRFRIRCKRQPESIPGNVGNNHMTAGDLLRSVCRRGHIVRGTTLKECFQGRPDVSMSINIARPFPVDRLLQSRHQYRHSA